MSQLATASSALSIPSDKTQYGSDKEGVSANIVTVPPSLSTEIRKFCRVHKVTASAVFLATFKILLHRYTGNTELIIGVPTMRRPDHSFENIVGYFVNMIAIRSVFQGTKTFADYVNEIQLITAEGLDNSDIPFPIVLRRIAKKRGIDTPLFNVAFEYQNSMVVGIQGIVDGINSLSVEILEGICQQGEYEVVLEVIERADKFLLRLKYSSRKYSSSLAEEMLANFISLLSEAVTNV